MKLKLKRYCAIMLTGTLLVGAILPNIKLTHTEAYQGQFGVCIDHGGPSNPHSYHEGDVYVNRLHEMTEYTYGTEEYKKALAENVAICREIFGSDQMALAIFWAAIACWTTNGDILKYGDSGVAQYWANYAQQAYADSLSKGYMTALPTSTFAHISELELGEFRHGKMQEILARDPFLAAICDYDHFFNSDWKLMPQFCPRLSNAWRESYISTGMTSENKTGIELWPVNSATHTVTAKPGEVPTLQQVQDAALDMETDSNYWYGVTSGPTSSKSKKNENGEYWIDMDEMFYNNSGDLQIWDNSINNWRSFPIYLVNTQMNVNGWTISSFVDKGHWFVHFKYDGGEGGEVPLIMYVKIPQNSIVSADDIGFDSPIEFVATYIKAYQCQTCSKPSDTRPHQTHISFVMPNNENLYPCFRLGKTDPVPGGGDVEPHFCIFSHSEDFEANYNVQMDKYDYETGQPLEDASFELYERFDDAGEINTESDGPETLFEGDESLEHSSGYLSQPVIWDDFRLVTSAETDENGHISYTVKKQYHYEKTFCDGHPKPVVSESASEETAAAVEEWWQAMVDACEAKAEEMPGVHFHWLLDESGDGGGDEESEFALDDEDDGGDSEDGGGDDTGCPGLEESFEKSGAKADRDATYEKFINLKYSYTWKEVQAKYGYIRHDTHTDDVPIEVITTNSSEAGAESEFADEYSKDITINESVGSDYVDSDSGEDGGEEEEEEGFSLSWQSILSPFTLEAHASEIHTPDEMEESDFFEDEEYDLASPSNANWRISLTNHGTAYLSDPGAYAMALEDEGDDGGGGEGEGAADFEIVYEAAFEGEQVGGEDVEPGPSDNYSHCNDEDGEGNSWRIYDHRTEGEIHFNKRDMNLLDQDAGEFDAYGIANADGALEGAVYGLFAAEDIVHPDQKTGTIYWRNDLVAVATTDRNGDGSFMVYTEAPGHTYDYESGSIVENEHASSAQKNLFGDNSETEWHVDDYTIDGEYKGGPTQRLYENNNDNNGNYWIGRPLILGHYYIKELSRSEGYELSVNGRMNNITNRGEDFEIKENDEQGSVSVTENLYIFTQQTVAKDNEPMFEVTSSGTSPNGGYDIVVDKLPEGTTFTFGAEHMIEAENEVFDHYEYVPKKDENGNIVYETADTPGIPKLKGDGSDEYLQKDQPADYYLNRIGIAKIMEFDDNEINEALKGEGQDGGDGTLVYPDLSNMNVNFNVAPGSSYQMRFVKWKLEAALRASGLLTPGNESQYSEQEMPVYAQGIREGETDRWNVSGAGAGNPATTTVYGPQIIKLQINKTKSDGSAITNGDMITELLQYYKDNPYWNFGGIDNIEDNAAENCFDVYIYAHNTLLQGSFAVLGENDEDTIILRRLTYNPDDLTLEPYYVYVPYTFEESDDSFSTYKDFTISKTYGITTVTARLSPDVTIDGDGNLEEKITKVFETYEVGEQIHDKNGDPVPVMERKEVTKKVKDNTYTTEWIPIESRYENGVHIIHIDLPFTDQFGNTYDDIESALAISFKAIVPEEWHVLTEEDINNLVRTAAKPGDKMISGEYEVEVLKAKANAYLDYAAKLENQDSTYIELASLLYPADIYTFQDGTGNPGSGTQKSPIRIMERPIRQKVKVVKDIQVMPDSETYMHDTYSDVHNENIEGKENDGSNVHVTDWLTELQDGDVDGQSPLKIPGFRFKAYLKSNLERLYRNESGDIIWTDRNGNAYVPTPKDTNNDGNYDTFTLVSGTEEIDFPEEHIVSNGSRVSSNVQKLYTQVEHNTSSTTTGDNANNVWAEYGTPQGGDTSQVGELREDNTSLDGDNGEAVHTNGALYSYDGKNVNVKETDKINAEQNTGYTRLLETEVVLMEDGAGKTRNVETYNYEKFFDAMAAANTDKWDNDMFTTYDGDGMDNYPGQNWFNTFDEKYQKDDRDEDHTLPNVDNEDADGSTGGDRDTSFKPFQWIREHLFGTTEDTKNNYPKTDDLPDTTLAEDAIYNAAHDNDNLENEINTSEFAHINSEASDAVRQFAIKWYLDDEVAKLLINNGYEEDVAKNIKIDGTKITVNEEAGPIDYSEQIYDLALYNALEKTYNYIRPFYNYDLDTIYSVEWDSAVNGGSDNDVTTLSADTLNNKETYYYGVSAYLPYGTYVVVEQQPYSEALDDFDNKNYKTDKPKEVVLPSVYEENGNETSPEILDDYYNYTSTDNPEKLAEKYFIRFNEEWAPDKTVDQRPYVIRAHNNDGDFEVYKYGLDVDKLTAEIVYPGSSYDYDGFKITQDRTDPLKDYYNDPIVDTAINGGNPNSDYLADNDNPGKPTASGNPYAENAIEARYHYGSISENSGIADDVLYPNGPETDDNNPSGYYFKDDVKTMTGNQTAYEGKYASMLVPWSVVEPAEETSYDITNFTGYADMKMRNTFYTTKLRIEKLDSETGENIVHDDAIFSIYAASRYTSRDEIENDSKKILDPAEKAEFLELTEVGDVKFYLQDTQITGSYEFLTAMGARDITPAAKGRSAGVGELWTGIVSEGTPVCLEEEQIIMQDMLGNKTGLFKVYATLNDIEMLDEDATDPDDKTYMDQNVGYFVTPQPLGAGVYVLVETKAPAGYARSKPVTIEIYSDGVSYYANGLTNTKVDATVYQGNLITDK